MRLGTRPGSSGDVASLGDDGLLRAYLEGTDREAAFAEFVDRFERRVYAVCFRYFGSVADAEDATQETFLRIARRADSFTGGSQVSTWVYRVAVNTCHDLARRRARRPEHLAPDMTEAVDASAQHDSLGWDHGDPAVTREEAAAVQDALAGLDEVSRSLLLLVAVQGLSYADAAAAHDMPVGTAKSRVHRARAHLAEILRPAVAEDAPPPPRNPERRSDVQPGEESQTRGGP